MASLKTAIVIICTTIIFILTCVLLTQEPQPSPLLSPLAEDIKPIQLNGQLLETYTNIYRQSINKPEIKHDDLLCQFATTRLDSVRLEFEHTGFPELSKIYYTKYPDIMGFGENLATGFFSEVNTLQGWIDSPTHKVNLDFNWDRTCVVCENTLCVQIFSRFH